MTAVRMPERRADAHAIADRMPDREPAAGLCVHTRDGRRPGRVKAAHKRCCLIDERFAFDYWLSRRAVSGVEHDRLQLGIDNRDVEGYLVGPDYVEDDHLEPVAFGVRAAGLSGAVA